MLPLLVSLSLSAKYVISTEGNYNITFESLKEDIKFKLPSIEGYSSYVILSNPPNYLVLNNESISSNVFLITNRIFRFTVSSLTTLYFSVVTVPDTCYTLEFMFNPQNGAEYEYSSSTKSLKSKKVYCLVVSGSDTFDVTFSNIKGTLSYSNYSLNDGLEVNESETMTLESTYSFVMTYSTSERSKYKANISFALDSSSSSTTTILYDNSKASYFSSTPVNTTAPQFPYLIPDIYTDKYNSKPTYYNITAGSYVVFTNWRDVRGYVSSGNVQLDILGNTRIVSILFNDTGILQINSTSRNNGLATFVVYNFSPNCHYIVTLSGERWYSLNYNTSYSKCMVSAFDSAQVQVSKGDHGNLEIFSYDGSPVSSEDDKFDFPIYSIFTNEDGSRDEWFKNDAKRYQNDTSINYAITGSTPEYNSYSISSDSYIIINTGEWPSAYVLPGWAIALCSIAGLIFFGVIAYFIWRCIKRRRNKATPSP
ncbi:hypothetical protein TVAG_073010, partial [Trichomonas vaginalis G3]